MKKSVLAAVVVTALGLSAMAPAAFAETTKMVGGAAMYPSKTIVANAIGRASCRERV